ncbi:alpha/beta hydrolase [Kribbella antibiotica]|uniref:Alpha/beta hydrolase n=1 Tax=Kribbella antibiotica TaxID=190195 RepID=A0A4V2YQP5_9ACTN|nr:alpha/beta hydrolase [Kribbella antibiotica]TDD62897.1 alpha/beta hydrolase [Kribbella antibiotica]
MTTEKLFKVNGVELWAETFGDAADPAVLLIHGASASMLWWETAFCAKLAARGRYVIRYDQRDTGRSTTYPVGEPPYAMSDLAADAIGLLDALGVERAHVVAQSMSGGTGLHLGVDHASRVASLTFVSTTTGDDELPPPSDDFPRFSTPDFGDSAAVEEYVVRAIEAESAGVFDEAAARVLVRSDIARATNFEASLTNHYAMKFDGPQGGGFGELTMPVLVVHGSRDPVFPLAHGQALRDAVPGGKLVVIEGAGHGIPEPLWEPFLAALVEQTDAR